MIVVYHLGLSQSERIVWLCEELEIPYELKIFERDPQTTLAPPEYKALHPMGTSPVVDDGTLRLAESGAIIEYILTRHGNGRLRPSSESDDYFLYLFWFHFANASLVPALAVMMDDGKYANAFRERLRLILQTLDEHLAGRTWLAGDRFSAADIMIMFPLTTNRLFTPFDIKPYPNLAAYMRRVAERPAYIRARQKSDPQTPVNLD